MLRRKRLRRGREYEVEGRVMTYLGKRRRDGRLLWWDEERQREGFFVAPQLKVRERR